MKKLFLLFLFITFCFSLSSCNEASKSYIVEETANDYIGNTLGPSFKAICCHYYHTYYVEDTATEIIYIFNNDNYGSGLCPYYNSEGIPMKIDEFIEIHTKVYH